MPKPQDLHEWVSFDDPEEDRTWLFDVTFLTSPWTCIFGNGCKGVLTEDFSEAVQGCCSYGAHFTGPDDIAHTEEMAKRLTASQWQFRDVGLADGIIQTNEDGETTTLLVEDACVFLNRPGFDGDGLGCAFHHAAEASGQRHLDLMPEVCWQLPQRREQEWVDRPDGTRILVSSLSEFDRRGWGEGGHDLHWWCTSSPEAHIGTEPVYRTNSAELTGLIGPAAYAELVRLADARLARGLVAPHPATVEAQQALETAAAQRR